MLKASDIDATDLFCGAGGFSTGVKKAGVTVRMALNHWDKAIECHNINHPETDHDRVDISVCSPKRYPSTRMLIGGPSCTNHTLAKGIKRESRYQPDLFGNNADPGAERSRATMWDIVRFAEYHRYDIVIVENVVDARAWILWDAWIKAMADLGYEHKPVYFNSMFAHPVPQSRDRMYIVFWKRGNKAPDLEFTPSAWCAHCEKNVEARQTWKNGRFAGKYRAQYIYTCPQCRKEVRPYYYAAANAIDWSLPIERIGDRKRPLKANTLRRIRVGLEKYAQPVAIDLAYLHAVNDRSRPVMDALNTLTTQQTTGLAVPPFIIEMYGNSNARGMDEALGTVMTNPHHGLAIPFLTSYYGTGGTCSINGAMPTITTKDKHALVMPMIVGNYTPG